MRKPEISVVMAAHNAAEYLVSAVESILWQTTADFDFIIVDDGSTDHTRDLLFALADRDRRIRVLMNETCLGLAKSLNKAIGHARGRFIARMDADDIAKPNRLTLQREYLVKNGECVLVGTNTCYMNETDDLFGRTHLPLQDEKIRWYSLFLNPFSHPTVMFRRTVFDEYGVRYDESFETTQDWALWIECLKLGRVANLPYCLVSQRVHSHSTSAKKREIQIANSVRVQQRYLQYITKRECTLANQFELINRVLFSDRLGVPSTLSLRVDACFAGLRVLDELSPHLSPQQLREATEFILDRVIRIGVLPPVPQGSLRLIGVLVLCYPLKIAGVVLKIVLRRCLRNFKLPDGV